VGPVKLRLVFLYVNVRFIFDFRPSHYGSVADLTVKQLNKPGIYEEMAHFSSIPGIRK